LHLANLGFKVVEEGVAVLVTVGHGKTLFHHRGGTAGTYIHTCLRDGEVFLQEHNVITAQGRRYRHDS